jgi:hypothetical protein
MFLVPIMTVSEVERFLDLEFPQVIANGTGDRVSSVDPAVQARATYSKPRSNGISGKIIPFL